MKKNLGYFSSLTVLTDRQVDNFNDERALLKGLASHDPHAIELIYRQNYGVIEGFIIKNNGFAEDARDVFQEAMVILFEKAQSDSFELNCLIKTYLFSFSRRIWLKRVQKNKKTYLPEMDILEETIPVEEDLETHLKRNEDLDLMEAAMNKIGEPCKSLLEAFYLQKKSMPEIADQFGYTNADNAKTQKYKCLNRLKKIFFSQYKTEE
ncbi:MAG TPA: sigma-70 family RNA polymerase sigma factor [Ginsengibacter sp.]|nr:sigma-70 family RNA polymerase sigma factor [Ginsengibacter sp.]